MSTTPTDSTSIPALPDKPKAKKTGRIVGIAAVALAVIVAVVLLVVNLTGGGGNNSGGRVTVKIGTTNASADEWPILVKLAATQGIDIK